MSVQIKSAMISSCSNISPPKYWPCAFVYNAAARNSLAFDRLFDGKFDKLSLKIGWVSIYQFFLYNKKKTDHFPPFFLYNKKTDHFTPSN